MVLMARAQLNANWASCNLDHSYIQTGGGENLAWGYNGDAYSSRSPFRGWYDEEKNIMTLYKLIKPNILTQLMMKS